VKSIVQQPSASQWFPDEEWQDGVSNEKHAPKAAAGAVINKKLAPKQRVAGGGGDKRDTCPTKAAAGAVVNENNWPSKSSGAEINEQVGYQAMVGAAVNEKPAPQSSSQSGDKRETTVP
jgi:hypothetical protein